MSLGITNNGSRMHESENFTMYNVILSDPLSWSVESWEDQGILTSYT